jgi:hypothetical protein
VYVFIEINRFREQDQQCRNNMAVPLTEALSDSRRLIAVAIYGLKQIYCLGYGRLLQAFQPASPTMGVLVPSADGAPGKYWPGPAR